MVRASCGEKLPMLEPTYIASIRAFTEPGIVEAAPNLIDERLARVNGGGGSGGRLLA
jgi:hypothetical protein